MESGGNKILLPKVKPTCHLPGRVDLLLNTLISRKTSYFFSLFSYVYFFSVISNCRSVYIENTTSLLPSRSFSEILCWSPADRGSALRASSRDYTSASLPPGGSWGRSRSALVRRRHALPGPGPCMWCLGRRSVRAETAFSHGIGSGREIRLNLYEINGAFYLFEASQA